MRPFQLYRPSFNWITPWKDSIIKAAIWSLIDFVSIAPAYSGPKLQELARSISGAVFASHDSFLVWLDVLGVAGQVYITWYQYSGITDTEYPLGSTQNHDDIIGTGGGYSLIHEYCTSNIPRPKFFAAIIFKAFSIFSQSLWYTTTVLRTTPVVSPYDSQRTIDPPDQLTKSAILIIVLLPKGQPHYTLTLSLLSV